MSKKDWRTEGTADALSEGEFYKALGAAIRSARRSRNLTLEALATRAGVSAGYLSSMEVGKIPAGIGKVRRIAAAMGLRVAHLLQEIP